MWGWGREREQVSSYNIRAVGALPPSQCNWDKEPGGGVGWGWGGWGGGGVWGVGGGVDV